MKMNSMIQRLTLTAALISLAGGCAKKEETSAPPSREAHSASVTVTTQVQNVVSAVDQAAKDATQKVTAEGDKVKAQVQDAAQQAAAQATTQTDKLKQQGQDLIDRASKLVADTKYAEAATVLKQLAGSQLTPEQQKQVDNLKATVQNALAKNAATEGTKAVGDLLGGKK